MFAAGVTMTVLGGGTVIGGFFTLLIGGLGSICIESCPDRSNVVVAGGITTLVGVSVLVPGIVLTVLGGKKVPVAQASLTPIVSPRFVGLRASF
jgi:hypothetical protein